MKKTIFILLLFITLFGFHFKSDAATATSQAGMVATGGGNLNVRSSASTSSSIKTRLGNGSYVTILSSNGSFYYVEYSEGAYGYVHKDYVNVKSSNVRKVNTGGANLNVRYGPSTSYYAFDKVRDQDYVIILSNEGAFSKVLFEGNKIGYVSNSYLALAVSNGSIYLSVPSFKQYDSRWAYLTLGSSGETMKASGCLTTSISMTESYRSGTTITPAAMRNRLSYTSSGNMYWPSNYKTSTSSSYISTVYSLLQQGKPVLIGLKNAYGGQHWVVITGFTGGSSSSLGNYTINDPASSSNTKLNQVVAKYPYFYKIGYYY